jgi:hypothetical protein
VNVTFTSNSYDERDDYDKCWYTCGYMGWDADPEIVETRWYLDSNYTYILSNLPQMRSNY